MENNNRCIAITSQNLKCKHKKFGLMFCKLHSNSHKPKKILFNNIQIKTIREDEYPLTA